MIKRRIRGGIFCILLINTFSPVSAISREMKILIGKTAASGLVTFGSVAGVALSMNALRPNHYDGSNPGAWAGFACSLSMFMIGGCYFGQRIYEIEHWHDRRTSEFQELP